MTTAVDDIQADHEAEKSGKDPDLVRLETLAASLHAKGVDFAVERGIVHTGVKQRDPELRIDLGKEHIRLGIVSDSHAGSKYEQLSALRHFYDYCDERRVDAFINCGDITQGSDKMHPGMNLEVHAHGSEEQVGYTVGTYPASKRKKRTYVIGGNHDWSFAKDSGANVVRQITDKRPDMVYVGQDAAYLTIANLRMYLMHPSGGGAYAKSYKMQKFAAALPTKKDVSLLLLGHYHNYASSRERDTHGLMLPCFQGQYPWLAAKGLHPDIGGILVDLWLDDAGRLARFAHEFVAYPQRENDWDHEISAAVSRGWTPDGLVVR